MRVPHWIARMWLRVKSVEGFGLRNLGSQRVYGLRGLGYGLGRRALGSGV